MIVLRRKLRLSEVVEQPVQPLLSGITLEHRDGDVYEHAVLVTNWREADLLAVAQMYRDRAGAANLFDELKNQWGWTGFSTQDLKRSQLMARIVALVYKWWSIFTRMGTGRATARRSRLTGPNQIADMQLLVLAHRHQGQLATFDTGLKELASGTRYANSLLIL